MSRKRWTNEENEVMRDHYTKGLEFVMTLLPERTAGSIRKQAGTLGLSKEHTSDESPHWPTPAMDLLQQLACVRFRNWRGPVNDGPLIWSLG